MVPFTLRSMTGGLLVPVRRWRDEIETRGEMHGLSYPWWIAVTSALLQPGIAVLALTQRDGLLPPSWLALSLVLIAGPHVVQFAIRPWVPWWLTSLLVFAGVVLLMSEPATAWGPLDIAPAVLVVLAAEIGATEGIRPASVVTGVSIVWLFARNGVDANSALHVLEVTVGFVVGLMMNWQMRALVAERAALEDEGERAALAERQRIAREIHDLVGHSLSVTLLHVTGARRALAEDADPTEAIEALTNAERIGRQAMQDIRRTVSVLATGPAGVQPLPGASEIVDLVKDAEAAGVVIDFEQTGDLVAVPAAAGLCLYRAAQESLANAVRHAPGAPVTMVLSVSSGTARLLVSNPLPERFRIGADGTGLRGMAARAEPLGGTVSAGPDSAEWCVDLFVPASGAGSHCVVRRMLP